MAVVAAMDGGAESVAVRTTGAFAAVMGDDDEMVRSDALHLLNLAAWKRTEHVHAPF
jgi:hypothetical protein